MKAITKTIKKLAVTSLFVLLPLGNATAGFIVDIHQTGIGGIGNLAAADAVIATGGSLLATGMYSTIDLDDLGDGTTGNFAGGSPFPGGFTSSFAAHVTGTISIASAGTYTFGLNHDDGARLDIGGGILTVAADGVVDNRNTEASVFFAAGLYSVDIVYFENFGGASLEFFTRSATGAPVLVRSVPEPAALALLGLGLLGLNLSRRRRQA